MDLYQLQVLKLKAKHYFPASKVSKISYTDHYRKKGQILIVAIE